MFPVRPKTSPWTNFKGTWQLPKRITKEDSIDLGTPLVGTNRWNTPVISTIDLFNVGEKVVIIYQIFCILQTKETKIGREQAHLDKVEFQKKLVIKEDVEELCICLK